MRKFIALALIVCGLVSAEVLPYKPKPIIWVHGINGSSGDWGAPTRNREDWIPAESIAAHPEGTYAHFLNDFMLPVVNRWWDIDPSYTKPGDPAYPNKTFLEVINFDYNTGSTNAEGGWDVIFPPYVDQIGQEAEIRQRIKEVLEEYYGPNWQSDTSAKVILVCHSMGTLSSRYGITQEPGLADHIAEIVTIGGMHKGATFMMPVDGELWAWHKFVWCFDTPLVGPSELTELILLGWKNVTLSLDLIPVGTIIFLDLQLHKYTDAGYDLAPTGVYNYLNSSSALDYQRLTNYKTITSKDIIPVLAELIPFAIVAIQVPGLIAEYGLFGGLAIAGFKTWSAYEFVDFFNNSDGAVYGHVQAAENLGLVTEEDTILVSGILHGAEPKQWNLFRDAIEPPVSVSIDSAVVFTGATRTAYALPNENNVIETAGDSLFLKGRTNVYFLANPVEAGVSLNGSGYIRMQWAEALGREGQGFFFKVPFDYLFVPENYIDFPFSREIEKSNFEFISGIDILNYVNIIMRQEA